MGGSGVVAFGVLLRMQCLSLSAQARSRQDRKAITGVWVDRKREHRRLPALKGLILRHPIGRKPYLFK